MEHLGEEWCYILCKENKKVHFMKEKINTKLIAEYLGGEDSDFLFEMANISQKRTGLPMIIWISEKRSSHGPRIKVQKGYWDKIKDNEWFYISVSDNPKIVAGDQGEISNKDVKLVEDFIKLNLDLTLRYWNKEILTDELLDELKEIKNVKIKNVE